MDSRSPTTRDRLNLYVEARPLPADDRQARLAAVALQLAERLELPEVLDQLAQQTADLLGGVCQVRFSPPHRPRDVRRVIAAPGSPPARCEAAAAADTYAALLARLDSAGSPGLPPGEGRPCPPAAELLLAPLVARGRRIGMIDVVLSAGDDSAVVRDLALLRELAAHGALAVDTADRLARAQPAPEARPGPANGADPGPLLALVAHDLRGPLATLSASVQLLVRTVKGADELDRCALSRLTELAEAAVAQLETQVEALTPAPARRPPPGAPAAVDLVKLTRLMANFYQQTTGRHRLSVSAELDELPGPWARPHIERVLGNLLLNAIKYSPGGGEIRVVVGREDDSLGGWATLRVQDAGIGIPSGDLPQLSQPGFRGRNVGAIPGTGFGLASVREVVEQYGGTLALWSAVGASSTVVVRLPLAPPPAP